MARAVALGQPWTVEVSAGGHSVHADTVKAGVGGSTGMRPHDLLEAAVASCMAITARMALADLGAAQAPVEVRVDLVRGEGRAEFRYEVILDPAMDVHREAVMARVAGSPVRRTLGGELTFAATAVGQQ